MAKAKIIMLLLELTKSKWFKSLILFIILTPIILIFSFILLVTSVITSIIGSTHNEDSFHTQAILEVKESSDISNDLSSYLVRSIDLYMDHEYIDSFRKTKNFVDDYFVDSRTYETEDEDGAITNNTTYFFKSRDEIFSFIALEPFNFSEDEILLIKTFENIELGFTGNFSMPLSDYTLTSDYGYRVHPITGVTKMHKGIDIVPPHHAQVMSITDGIIVDVNMTDGNSYGNNVTIKHDLGSQTIYSFYAHLSKIYVSEGQMVFDRETIGLEGGDPNSDPNPGSSTGHHLHFEIWTDYGFSYHTDPKKYLIN